MITETPNRNGFVSTAVLFLTLACLSISIGCGSNLEHPVASKSPTSPPSAAPQVPPTKVEAKQISFRQPAANQPSKPAIETGSAGHSPKPEKKPLSAEQVSKNDGAAKPNVVTKTEAAKKDEKDGKKKYTDQQLNKNQTTLVLAHEPDMRARQLLLFIREYLTHDQQTEALKMLMEQDHRFQRLIRKRQEILNVATDGDQTEEKLRQIRIETVELGQELRNKVYGKIMTPEQRATRRKEREKIRLAEEAEAEKRKIRLAKEEAEAKQAEAKQAEAKQAEAKQAEAKQAEAEKRNLKR